jgi:hypothetical protein
MFTVRYKRFYKYCLDEFPALGQSITEPTTQWKLTASSREITGLVSFSHALGKLKATYQAYGMVHLPNHPSFFHT